MLRVSKNFIRHHFIIASAIISIILATLLSYSYICDYFFTTADALTLIETSRIQSFNDVIRIFTEPMMSNTKFELLAKYYRPVAMLSFSLDYSIWELNPFGYHLTDLVIHILVSIVVFFLMLSLTKGKYLIAWLTAIIFTIHPVHIEVVPGIARRFDTIATLFILLSLLSFLKYLNFDLYKRPLLFISIIFYLLALGSKEHAVLLLPLIFTYLMIFSHEKSFKISLVQAIKRCLPYFLITFIYLSWRIYILYGIGGRSELSDKPHEVSMVIQSLIKIITMYLVDLLYSVDFLIFNLLFNFLRSSSASLVIICFLFIFLLFYSWRIFKIDHNSRWITKIIKGLFIILFILSLTGILTSSSISPYVNRLIPEAFLNKKIELITHAMEVRYPLSAEYNRVDLFLRLLFLAITSISALCLTIIHKYNKIKNYFICSLHGRLTGFLLVWLFLPLSIYLPVLTFTHPNIYISIIPFSALVTIIMVEKFQSVIQKIRGKEPINIFNISSFIIIFALLIFSLTYSPLVRKYKDWNVASDLYLMFFYKLSEIVAVLPDDTTIYIHNLPKLIFSSDIRVPRVQTATYLTDYAVKSWLNLNYPHNNIKVVSINRGGIFTDISEIKIEMREDNKIVNIFVYGRKIK
jgi:hypothetical protein